MGGFVKVGNVIRGGPRRLNNWSVVRDQGGSLRRPSLVKSLKTEFLRCRVCMEDELDIYMMLMKNDDLR